MGTGFIKTICILYVYLYLSVSYNSACVTFVGIVKTVTLKKVRQVTSHNQGSRIESPGESWKVPKHTCPGRSSKKNRSHDVTEIES